MASAVAVKQDTSPTTPSQKFEGQTDRVTSVTHLPGGRRMIICSIDGSLGVWNLNTGKQIATWRDGKSEVYVTALSPDGKKLVSGGEEGEVKVWNIDTGKVIATWVGHTDSITSVCWTQNQNTERVLGGYGDGIIRVWDVKSGNTILHIKTGFRSVWGAIYSPDMTIIAHGGFNKENGKIEIRNANTGKLLTNLEGHTWTVRCLAWTVDGATLVSGSEDHTIRTWNTTTWQQITVFTGHTDTVCDIALAVLSPNDGHTTILASAALGDKTARLWNLENGQLIGSPIQHSDRVRCVSFSKNGKILVTACDDENTYSWDVPAIIKKAELDKLQVDLSLNDGGKTVLDANATRNLVQQSENPRRLHTGFFDQSPQPVDDPSITRSIDPSSAAHASPGFLERARNSLLKWARRQNNDSIELQRHRPTIVNVPFTKRKRMYYSKQQALIDAEKKKARDAKKAQDAKNEKNNKNAIAGSSQPPESNITQQPVGPPQAESSSGPQAAVSTLSTTPTDTDVIPADTTAAVAPLPDVIAIHTGCLTRFLLFIGCLSVQRTGSHHQ